MKKAMELMTIPTKWTHQGKIVEQLPDDCEGFVYLITNLANNRKYIGKKLARFKVTRPPLKGRTNKRRSTKESDWRDYWGSSEHLNADVISFGEDKFTREILHYCSSRGELSYLELYEQITRNAILIDEYYNGIIQCKIHSTHVSSLKEMFDLSD
jgi:hypothetical protein